jgi:hypothetical protein
MRDLTRYILFLSHLLLFVSADRINFDKLLPDEDEEEESALRWSEMEHLLTSEPPNSYFLCPASLPPRKPVLNHDELRIWPFPYGPYHYPALYDLCSGLSSFPNAGCLCRAPGYSTAMNCYSPPANEDIFDSLLLEYCWSKCFCRIKPKQPLFPPPRPSKRHPRPLAWTRSPVTTFTDGEERRAWINEAYGGWRVIEERGSGTARFRVELVVIPPQIDIDIPKPRFPLQPLTPQTPALDSTVGQGKCKAKAQCNSFEALNGGCGSGCQCFFNAASAPWFGKGTCGASLLASAVQIASAGLNGRDLDLGLDLGLEGSLADDEWDTTCPADGVCACNATFVARACCASELGGIIHESGGGSGGQDSTEKLGELSFET